MVIFVFANIAKHLGYIYIPPITGFIIFILIAWLYYSCMESSSRQGTFGKIVVGIILTDTNGNRITFDRASARFFCKIISTIILYIGYIMAGFTDKKQGLHDIITGCYVVNKDSKINDPPIYDIMYFFKKQSEYVDPRGIISLIIGIFILYILIILAKYKLESIPFLL